MILKILFFFVLAASHAIANVNEQNSKSRQQQELYFVSLDSPAGMRLSTQSLKKPVQKESDKLEIDQKTSEKFREDLTALIEEAHHSMEGEVLDQTEDLDVTDKKRLKQVAKDWVANFNLYEFALNSYRWLQIKQADPKYREHTLNLIYLLGASHTLETLSGPVGVLLANQAGVSNAGLAIIGTIGGIISIPGFDPLCLVLMSFYKTSEGFQKFTTQVRILSSNVARGIYKQSRIPVLIDALYFQVSSRQRIRLLASESGLEFINDQLLISVYEGSDLKLSFSEKDGKTFLSEIQFSASFFRNYEMEPQKFAQVLKRLRPLGHIFYHSIKQLFDLQLKVQAAPVFYARKISDQNRIEIKDFAMTVSGKRAFRNSVNLQNRCDFVFY